MPSSLRGALTVVAAAMFAAPALAQQPTADALIADCAAEPTLELENQCLRSAISDLAGRMTPAQQESVTQTPPAPEVQGLGAEQVMAREDRRRDSRHEEDEDDRAEAIVVDFSRTRGGDYIFVLDNGQVWAQQDFDRSTSLNLDEDKDYRVEIVKGFLSGYRLRLLDEGRLLKVERLR